MIKFFKSLLILKSRDKFVPPYFILVIRSYAISLKNNKKKVTIIVIFIMNKAIMHNKRMSIYGFSQFDIMLAIKM